MCAAVPENIIEKLEIPVGPGVETGRRPDGGEFAAQIDLGIAHVRWIGGNAQETNLRSERIAGVWITLSAGYPEPAKAKLVDEGCRKCMCFADGQVDRMSSQGSPEPRQQRLIQNT